MADGGASSSPFARKGGLPINAVKSNSFFEKVDAADSEVAARLRTLLHCFDHCNLLTFPN